LFLLRNGSKYAGMWGLVGGKLQRNESVIDGLHREIQEELGHVEMSRIIPLEKYVSDNDKFVYHTFLAIVEQEFVPTLNEEHRGYCWCSLNDIPKPQHPGLWNTFNLDSVAEKLATVENTLSSVQAVL
jgi:8-oxo-dGTP pyrophosphatase MutT (NUDIX family)